MLHSERQSLPLKQMYPVKEACRRLDLSYLHAATREEDNEQTLRRLLMVLRANHYMKIEDVLEASWADLGRLRQMGDTSLELLAALFERIVKHPDLLIDEASAEREQKLQAIKKRLREMGLVQ
ncbi:hypothetical protein [Paenibacillus sp. 1P07SE]|uniref:hypothetical protein n=1 Tax=Paenibacillus sp. 1P07SE TaxID=3132209 RepID=UPI0039A71D9C